MRLTLFIKPVSVFLMLTFLGACASMPIASIWKLRNLDMLSTDPAEIRVAVVTHEHVKLNDQSTVMTIRFDSEDTQYNFESTIHASIRRGLSEQDPIFGIPNGKALSMFYLAPDEAEKLKVAQSRILNIRESGIKGSGSLSININTGCFNAPAPGTLPTDIYARFDRHKAS